MMLVSVTVLIISVLLYLENVLMGSAISVHDCEIGSASRLEQPDTMSRQEFFGRFLPFVLLCLGIPRTVIDPVGGLTLLLASGLFYFGSKKWRSVTNP